MIFTTTKHLLLVFLGTYLIFDHARFEANVTSPHHRLQNSEDPTASLFSRLDQMERFRLIDGNLCLYRKAMKPVEGGSVWYTSTLWYSKDPYSTNIPSDGYANDISRVQLLSCTQLQKDKK